ACDAVCATARTCVPYCEHGVSPAFTSDKRHILFGAPGVYDWKGMREGVCVSLWVCPSLSVVAGFVGLCVCLCVVVCVLFVGWFVFVFFCVCVCVCVCV